MVKFLISSLLLIPICIAFYENNELNYKKAQIIQENIVRHPEKLPTPEIAKLGSFGFANVLADMYWLKAVQYIGSNVIESDYKKYLYEMIEIITELNPYFESPYVIGQLLLPSSKGQSEDYSGKNITEDMLEAKALGIKGVENFCDKDTVQSIISESDLGKVLSEQKYQNPCQSYKIPYYLAYIYYFYLKEPENAAHYYKVVAAQSDAPEGAKILAAIMQGRSGEREKSLFMFLSLAQSLTTKDDACGLLTRDLQQIYYGLGNQSITLNGQLIRDVENARERLLPEFKEEKENEILDDTQCTNYLVKAIRELNLLYLQNADALYTRDNPESISAMSPEILKQSGYIDFIPTDYQQYEDYGIVYRYNDEIGRFDFEMGN